MFTHAARRSSTSVRATAVAASALGNVESTTITDSTDMVRVYVVDPPRRVDRPEVWWHVGRNHRPDEERRGALHRVATTRPSGRGRGLRDVGRDQPPARALAPDPRGSE